MVQKESLAVGLGRIDMNKKHEFTFKNESKTVLV